MTLLLSKCCIFLKRLASPLKNRLNVDGLEDNIHKKNAKLKTHIIVPLMKKKNFKILSQFFQSKERYNLGYFPLFR